MKLNLKIFLFLIFVVAVLVTGYLKVSDSNLFAMLVTNADDLLNLINKENGIDRYAPADLVELSDLGFKGQRVRVVAYPQLKRLIEDAKTQGLSLKITSAYRSYDRQKSIFDR